MSSPLYPQSNGMAERHIQTIKNLLRKVLEDNKEVPLALLHYRNTPLIDGFAPAQLLMSRQLRSNLPTTNKQLQPRVINFQKYNQSLRSRQNYSENNYNQKYNVRKLPPLKQNDPV